MSRHLCYPVFLPQAGCPYRCVYCNQPAMVGDPQGSPDLLTGALGAVDELAERAGRTGKSGEIAFYGGTFTLLERSILKGILDRAGHWVQRGRFTGIRFSTRPDALEPEMVKLLAAYPIVTVELGVQSLSDRVLHKSGRGYDIQTVRTAARRIKAAGWRLGCQLMPGLPGDTCGEFSRTIAAVIALEPHLVRLYPTLVLEGTVLAKWWRQGRYRPLTLEQAIEWCVDAYEAFLAADIAVNRMGLHGDAQLQRPGLILAGPFHPAFGYLVRARWWRKMIEKELTRLYGEEATGRSIVIRVDARRVSEVVGLNKENLNYFRSRWELKEIRVQGEAGRLGNQREIVVSDETSLC